MNYQYSYFIGDLVLLFFWLVLYFWRKDVRKQMLIISAIFAIGGLIVDPVYFVDWWSPQTILGLMPGIESLLFGFTVGGIASVIFIEFVREKVKSLRPKRLSFYGLISHLSILSLFAVLFFLGVFLFKLNSFYASIPAFLIPLSIILVMRKDLFYDSLVSGFLLTIVSIPSYIIPELITPGWIAHSWNFDAISGITFIKIPIEDLIWFFLTGMFIGPLYEFWLEKKLVKG